MKKKLMTFLEIYNILLKNKRSKCIINLSLLKISDFFIFFMIRRCTFIDHKVPVILVFQICDADPGIRHIIMRQAAGCNPRSASDYRDQAGVPVPHEALDLAGQAQDPWLRCRLGNLAELLRRTRRWQDHPVACAV